MILFGAAALVVTMSDTVRLFLKTGPQTAYASLFWAVWAIALVMPLVWVWRPIVWSGP